MKTLFTLIIGLACVVSVHAQLFNYVTNTTKTVSETFTRQMGSTKLVHSGWVTNVTERVTLQGTNITAVAFDAGVAAAGALGLDTNGISSKTVKQFQFLCLSLAQYAFDVDFYEPTNVTGTWKPLKHRLLLDYQQTQFFIYQFGGTNNVISTNNLRSATGRNLQNSTNGMSGFWVVPSVKKK